MRETSDDLLNLKQLDTFADFIVLLTVHSQQNGILQTNHHVLSWLHLKKLILSKPFPLSHSPLTI